MNNPPVPEVLKDFPQETLDAINKLRYYKPELENASFGINSAILGAIDNVKEQIKAELNDDQLWYVLEQVIKLPDVIRSKYQSHNFHRWNIMIGDYDEYLHYFHHAVCMGWLHVVQVLLRFRPQLLTQRDKENRDGFYYAFMHKEIRVLRFLIKEAGEKLSLILRSDGFDDATINEFKSL